ncbi:cysteine hydrolase family protein [Shouchella shacheensis]|uniref:cysteine hydrolase family protein n=1 Tax=Shouchella shacheensis TaxID=1649580 RepID=UPI00073FBC92|nr:isochorismatase family cysteine hydrolase [Shouchella shacheensis]
MRALLVIDYTEDFIAHDGALTVGAPGQAVEQKITETIETFHKANDFVVFAVDVHDEGDIYHPETKLFPPHNLRGTKGRDLYGRVGELYEEIKGSANVYFMDKTRYSAFVGTDLDVKLRERGITEVHLVGDVTDICVLHTAVYAYSLGYELVVYKDAVASFDAAGHEWALGHFENALGAKVL